MTHNPPKHLPFHFLNVNDVNKIHQLIQVLANKFNSIENNEFQDECARLAQQLPRSLKKSITKTKMTFEGHGYLIVSGFPLDDKKIGDSPESWDVPWVNATYFEEEIFQCLLTASAGRVFGWRTQENGRFLRHITPMKKDAMEQLGGSSKVPLLWHTKEAFHPAKASLFTLMCYRNNEQAHTLFVDAAKVVQTLSAKTIETLMQPVFIIEPDTSHSPTQNYSQYWELHQQQFSYINDFFANPKPTALLFKENDLWRFCIGQAFTVTLNNDAENAIIELWEVCEKVGDKIILNPGEIAIINNNTVAHGRSIYVPNYGKQQRWMRRVNCSTNWDLHQVFVDQDNSRVIA